MADFTTTNAVALVATLGGLLAACAGLLFLAINQRARQRNAARRLFELAEQEGRFACDAMTSRFVHDLNNIILVMSMESERLGASEQTEVLRQVVAECRDVVERCRAQMAPIEALTSDLCSELRLAARVLSDAGFRRVDVAIARTVPAVVIVPGPASNIHLLVLSLVRAAGVGGDVDSLSLTVSKGRDASLPEDGNDSGWINVSAIGPVSLVEDDASGTTLSRIAKRLSAEVVFPDPGSGRRRVAVSLPVVDG